MRRNVVHAIFCLVGLLFFAGAVATSKADIHQDSINIERNSEIFVARGQGLVTQIDVDVFLSRIPEHHRPAFISDPGRLADMLEKLLVPRQLAEEARSLAPNLLEEPLFEAQMYQAAVVQIAERYMDYLWEDERLSDYTDQAKELYLVRKDLLRQPIHVDFTQILVLSDSKRGELEAMKQIINIYEMLSDGLTLDELAPEYSEEPNAKNNRGLYEGVKLAALDPSIAEIIQQLKPGQISQPFRSEHGWHILELHSKTRPDIKSFEQVREQAINVAEQRHQASVRERVIRRLTSQPQEFAEGAVDALMERYQASDQDMEKLKADIRARLGQQKQ